MFRVQPNPTKGVDIVHVKSHVIVRERVPEIHANTVLIETLEACPQPLMRSKDAVSVSLWAKRFATAAAFLAVTGCTKSCGDGPYHPDDARPEPREHYHGKW